MTRLPRRARMLDHVEVGKNPRAMNAQELGEARRVGWVGARRQSHPSNAELPIPHAAADSPHKPAVSIPAGLLWAGALLELPRAVPDQPPIPIQLEH